WRRACSSRARSSPCCSPPRTCARARPRSWKSARRSSATAEADDRSRARPRARGPARHAARPAWPGRCRCRAAGGADGLPRPARRRHRCPAAGGAATAAHGLGGARAASRPRRPVGAHRRRARGPAPCRGHPRHCAGGSRSRPCPAARGRRGARTRPCARRGGPQAMSSVASKRAAAAKSAKKPAAKTVAKKATKSAAAGKAVAKPRIRARAGRLAKPEVHELFSRLRELNPRPTTELEYSTPLESLVAVALSAQATDVGVNKATRRLFPVANTPAAILALGEDGLKQYINTIGLFNAKAANVIATCRILLEKHGGEVPREREALEALPGV